MMFKNIIVKFVGKDEQNIQLFLYYLQEKGLLKKEDNNFKLSHESELLIRSMKKKIL